MHEFRIPSSSSIGPVTPECIVRVEALSNYSKVYFANGKCLIVGKVLQWFENRLPEEMFARVHRSHLVNRGHIMVVKGNTQNILLLSNGDKIMMSRRKKALFNS